MVKKRKIGLQSHFTPHTPPVAAEKCHICYNKYNNNTVTLHDETNSLGEKIIHKICNTCYGSLMVDAHEQVDCPFCRKKIQSPLARARGSAPASARGSAPAAQRHPANAEPETLVQIMTMVSALISAWVGYMIFWKIPPESLDLFGFCQTVAASTISLLIFLWLSASSSR
jgi:hypothetical protein